MTEHQHDPYSAIGRLADAAGLPLDDLPLFETTFTALAKLRTAGGSTLQTLLGEDALDIILDFLLSLYVKERGEVAAIRLYPLDEPPLLLVGWVATESRPKPHDD